MEPGMLSDKSRPVIAATLPVVAENIGAIAERFYSHMFGEHPELLDGLFNRGNQAEGTQQRALAGSVAVFATALVNHPDRLPEQLLSRIAHKHASLGLRPDQYEVVHDNLFWAIVDVLGEAVTPEVAAAWDEVYWLMAFALMNQERGLYSARGVRPDTVWRDWQVTEKARETDDVVSFTVKRIDDRLVKTSLPGQYVTVKLAMDDGVHQPRQYSLTKADDGEHRSFAVKRVHGGGKPAGEVSNMLHDRVGVGDVITMSLPFGDVVLDDSRPAVFLSAGIGITPMAGMLSHLVNAGSHLNVTLLHADVDEASWALRRQVVEDVRRLPHGRVHVWFERGDECSLAVDGAYEGFMDLTDVELPAGRLLPVRSGAVPAGRPQHPDRPRRLPARHPVRGVRAGPVAGGRHGLMPADGPVDLPEMGRELLAQARGTRAGRAARSLPVPGPGLRQTAIALRAGAELAEHESPGTATLHVLMGRVRLVAGDLTADLTAGQLLAIPPARHSLLAAADAVVLLSVVRQ
jgi:nitric oxide dioxygenase